MIKIIDNRKREYEYNTIVNTVSVKASPFREIFNADFGDITISNESGTFVLKDCLRLQVNVNKVGKFYLFLNTPEDKKDLVIEEIKTLKSIEVTSLITMLDKVGKLFNIAEKYNLLFTLYQSGDEYPLDLAIYRTFNNKAPLFYVDKNAEPPKENKPKTQEARENKPFEEQKESKKQKKKLPNWLNKTLEFLSPIRENWLHFLFVFVSALVMGYTGGVALYDSFAGKTIAIFFFTCTLVGAGLNVIVNLDTYKKHEIEKRFVILTGLTSLVGALLSTIAVVIFYVTQKEIPEGMPSLLGICAFDVVITLVLSYAGQWISTIIRKRRK